MRSVVGVVLSGFVVVVACSGVPHADDTGPNLCADYSVNASAAAACDQAIASEPDARRKSDLLAKRAYARDASPTADIFRASLADLNNAISLDAGNADALHERAYIFNEIGRWREAKQDLDAQIRLLPNEPAAYDERAMSRFNLGDLQGAFDDRGMEVKLAPTASALLAHAKAAMWVGRFDVADQDIAEARKRAPDDKLAVTAADVIAAQLTLWRSVSTAGASGCSGGEKSADYTDAMLIGDCTRAFLDGPTQKERAAALSARSLAWITGANDVAGFVEDSKIAAALDPGNVSLRSNLGFAYLKSMHPGAAVREFDIAIATAPDFANYAGRAQAKFNAGDFDGAEADANKSVSYTPNRIALTILGDVAYARTKTFDKAKAYWWQAYNSGPPDDGLVRRLTAAGIAIPQTPAVQSAPEPAAKSP